MSFTLRDLIEKLQNVRQMIVFYQFQKQEVFNGSLEQMPKEVLKLFGNKLVNSIYMTTNNILIIYI